MKETRGSLIAALAITAVLVLAGCSIAPSGQAGGGGTGGGGQSGQTGGSETSGDSSTDSPGDIDLDQFEGLPETFPTDEIALIDNPVDMGVDLGTGWSVLMKADDYAVAFAEASTLIKADGFEVVAENISDAGGVGVYQNDKYQVQLSASNSPDSGANLTYVVILRG